MNYIEKKYFVKIPKNVSMYYCESNHLIVFVTSFTRKTLILKTKVILEKKNRMLKITRIPFFDISNNERKKLKVIQGTQVSLLKQALFHISCTFCKKLNLIGVGFRVSTLKILEINLLHFKLGYSHQIYFKIPSNLKMCCLKTNRIFIIGYSYLFVTQIAFLIRSYKIPEPYKGKGVLYSTEKNDIKRR